MSEPLSRTETASSAETVFWTDPAEVKSKDAESGAMSSPAAGAETRSTATLLASDVDANVNANGKPQPKHALAGGIPITKLRSLEPVISPAARLARILSGRSSAGSEPKYLNTYPGTGTEDDPYLVDWLPGERANPYNWRTSYRWAVTAVVAMSCLCISFASSSYSAAIPEIATKYHVSNTVSILGLSLYVVGE